MVSGCGESSSASLTTVPSPIVPRQKSRFLPPYYSYSRLLREVRPPLLPPNFLLGATVGIVEKQKSRFLPWDNCTGHCSTRNLSLSSPTRTFCSAVAELHLQTSTSFSSSLCKSFICARISYLSKWLCDPMHLLSSSASTPLKIASLAATMSNFSYSKFARIVMCGGRPVSVGVASVLFQGYFTVAASLA